MDRYIGLDVHATSCTLTVVGPSGRKLSSQVLETNGQLLIEAIRAIAHPRHLCFEEGIQSAWLHELLSPHVDELVVMQSTRSRGPKSDARDALALAQALRLGSIDTIVFKAPKLFTRLRELTRVHSMIVQDATRTQCRIKALFRGRGIATAGKSVYNVAERQVWVSKLPESTQSVAGFLYTQLEANQQLKKEVERNLISELGHYPIGRVLQTCPGLGPIRTARLLSIVMTPHRFRTARQFWAYCGFGIVMRSSSDWVQYDGQWIRANVNKTRGLNRRRNPQLKAVFKSAATEVSSQRCHDPMHDDYMRLIQAGTKPNLAKLTLARKLAATVLAMWKNEEEYSPDKYRKPAQSPL